MSILDSLPKLPFLSKNSQTSEYFFALNIGQSSVVASVWGISGKNMELVNIAQVPYAGGADMALIEAANQALDEALKNFQPEPTKILFGVPDAWLQDDNLKDEYLNLLRKLVKELDLTPMAYVSTTHALTHFLQKSSGVPATTILVELSDPLIVTIVKAGKIIGSKVVKRGDDLPKDIERALLSFSEVEVLPSKIALYGDDSEKAVKFKDELTSFNWMSNLPFLHLPKIEVLEDQVPIKAISLAGASEINPDAVYHEHLSSKGGIPEEDKKEAGGFVSGDILQETNIVPVEENLPLRPQPQEDIKEEHFEEKGTLLNKLKSRLTLPLALLKKGEGVSISRSPRALLRNRKTFIALGVLIVLVLAYLFLPRAKVTVFIDPKILEKDAQVIADPKVTSVDEANKVIPGKIVELDITGSGKGSATGKKQIGDSAHGSVDVYNQTDSPQSFSQGTTLVGPNNLTFTLDQSISVASQSATLSGKTYGKVTVAVTATQIGPDSNLPSSTQLTIKGQPSSSFNAVVNQALSGGTSKDVTVVTTDDQKKLLAQVSSDLRNKAQSQLQGKLTGDQKILSEALDEKINSTSYSKAIGDQAGDFTLNLSTHYKGTAYSDNDLKLMVSKLVQTNVPEGYELKLSETETQADVSKLEKDGRLIFLARFRAKLIPKINLDNIKDQIKGKPPKDAAEIVKGLDNVVGSDISISPSLPGPLLRLPLISQNISFEVTAK